VTAAVKPAAVSQPAAPVPAVAVPAAPVPAVPATPATVDDGLAAELLRLTRLPAPAASDPVESAFGYLNTMRGLTS
jgi:hypothetical protein